MSCSPLAVLVLPVLALVVTGALARELDLVTRGHLTHQSRAIAHLVAPLLERDDPDALHLLSQAIGLIEEDSGTRIELVDPEARVVLGTPPRDQPDHLMDRAEVLGQRLEATAARHRLSAPLGTRELTLRNLESK